MNNLKKLWNQWLYGTLQLFRKRCGWYTFELKKKSSTEFEWYYCKMHLFFPPPYTGPISLISKTCPVKMCKCETSILNSYCLKSPFLSTIDGLRWFPNSSNLLSWCNHQVCLLFPHFLGMIFHLHVWYNFKPRLASWHLYEPSSSYISS